MKKPFTYKDAGVNIEKGEEVVSSIKDSIEETHTSGVISSIGGFGGLFQAPNDQYEDPVLVSSVDGVGTKLLVAFKSNIYHTVGQDLVNHCVNDIAVCGAKPLFFLDYFSTGRLESHIATDVLRGFTIACKENDVALIGGETAEMPDLYKEGEFDLAGTIVGIVDKSRILDGSKVQTGDICIGFESTGLHTNGYSLARKVLFDQYDVTDKVDELGESIGEALLHVHKSYLAIIQECLQSIEVHAFSHITGGGIEGNTSRVLSEDQKLVMDWQSWQWNPIFSLIQKTGNIEDVEMRKAFNLGLGCMAIVPETSVDAVLSIAKTHETSAWICGSIQSRQ
jgi:phosphoribosylformylglycinamidine cyclo-ligase